MSDNPYERDEPAVPEHPRTDPVATDGPTPSDEPRVGDDDAPHVGTDDARDVGTRPDDGTDPQPYATASDPEPYPASSDPQPYPAASDPEPYTASSDPEPYTAPRAPRSTSSDAETATWPAADPAYSTAAGDDYPTDSVGRDAGDDITAATVGSDTATDSPATTGGTEDTTTFASHDTDRGAGSHQAERPVPRSGLSEHQSAGYLTGERVDAEPAPAHDSHGSTWLAGGTAGAAGGAAGTTTSSEHDRDRASDRDDERRDRDRDAALLEGATVTAKPRSRARSHVWAVLLTLLLTPVAWYLLADAGARLTLPAGNPWETGNLNVAALLELGGGLLVLAVVLLAARWSSLGAIITGSLVLVVGVPFVAVPTWTQEILEPAVAWLHDLGDFGSNVVHHLVASGSTGRLVVYGLALIFIGVISHGARRQGRREVRPVDAA